jgi:hypothetical protein
MKTNKLSAVAALLLSTLASTLAGCALAGCALGAETGPETGADADADADDGSVDVAQTDEALAAGCATCTIVAPTSIRGIEGWASRRRVRELLGAPREIRPVDFANYVWDYGRTEVLFAGGNLNKVMRVTTTNPKLRTADGIGVGSTKRELRTKLPDVSCEPLPEQPPACRLWDPATHEAMEFRLTPDGIVKKVVLLAPEF